MLIVALGMPAPPRASAGEAGDAEMAGFSAQPALALGERLYREGRGVDGEPVRAIVAGDVAVDGTMLTCVSCHRRSGLGSLEGSVIAWPISGKELALPRRRAGAWNPAKQHKGPGSAERWTLPTRFEMTDERPPYTDEALAHVLRTGLDPTGRALNRVMPRYELSDRDMAVLIHYLRNLSVDTDPGADEEMIRFATVVTDGVSPADREAMLATLRAHIDARNTQTRPHERRARSGPFYKTEKYGAYRKLALDVWELKGPPDGWRAQLEAYYRERPVFALLGGIAAGPWAPIHAFCEAHEIPAILPVTDQPVVSESDTYTLYFSKGLYQEGESAAQFLAARRKAGEQLRVLQVFQPGSKGEDAARGFRETWEGGGGTGLHSLPLRAGEEPAPAEWMRGVEGQGPTVLLLWLEADALVAAAQAAAAAEGDVDSVFVSWRLASAELARIPAAARDRLYVTYPYSLPEEMGRRQSMVDRWLTARRIPIGNSAIQAQMYFLGWMLPGALGAIRSEFYRDYFLEAFEMMLDQHYAIPLYHRLSFGPDQRYAAKGCYIARLSGDDPPRLVPVSDWVIN
jgi:hypothetical protein